MKAICFLLIFSLLWSKEYIVLNKPNNVYAKRLGRMIHQGDRLYQNDSIKLGPSSSILRMAGPNGIVTIHPKNYSSSNSRNINTFWGLVGEAVAPNLVSGTMKSRSGSLSTLLDVESYFQRFNSGSNSLLIIDSLLVPLDQRLFTNLDKQFFYLSYIKDNQVIDKKIPLSVKNNNLYLRLDRKLFYVDGKDSEEELIGPAALKFYDSQQESAISLTTFYFSHVSFQDLRTELCLISEAMSIDLQKMNAPEQDSIFRYVRNYFGHTDEREFLIKYNVKLNCKN